MNRTSVLMLVAVLGLGGVLVGQFHRVTAEQAGKEPAPADMKELQQQVKSSKSWFPIKQRS